MYNNLSEVESRLRSAIVYARSMGLKIRGFFPRLEVRNNRFEFIKEHGETDLVGSLLLAENLRTGGKAGRGLNESKTTFHAIRVFSEALKFSPEQTKEVILSFDMGIGLKSEHSKMGKRLRDFASGFFDINPEVVNQM